MALRTEQFPESLKEWKELLSELGFKQETSKAYADALFNEGYSGRNVRHLCAHSPGVPPPSFLDLGIKAGHCLTISLYFCPERSTERRTSADAQPFKNNSKVKIPRPMVSLDASRVDFDQFKFEWTAYKTHYQIDEYNIASQLFYCGDEEVRRRVRLQKPCFIIPAKYSESELLAILEEVVLSKISRIVHIKQFHELKQNSNEPCNDFLSRLQLKASCCQFVCKSCDAVNTTERIKEQFIVGLENKPVQTAILKTESVTPGTSLDKLVRETVVFSNL